MKKSIRFNPVDILVLIFSIVVVTMILTAFTQSDDFPGLGRDVDVRLIVEVETVPIKIEYAERIRLGLPVLDAVSGKTFGNIEEYGFHDVSSEIIPSSERMCVVTLKIACDAVDHGGYYTVNDERILISDGNEYLIPDLYFKGDCVAFYKGSAGKSKVQ